MMHINNKINKNTMVNNNYSNVLLMPYIYITWRTGLLNPNNFILNSMEIYFMDLIRIQKIK